MQTFLPHVSFARSGRALDPRRLGKQRVEVLQILRALHIEEYGWRSHPVVMMWRGHTEALVSYGVEITREWIRRGHADTVLPQLAEFVPGQQPRSQRDLDAAGLLPEWLGWRPLHLSHRSALVRKEPEWYRPLFPEVPDDLPYVWPECEAASPDEPEPFSAWVVRAPRRIVLARFRRESVVGLPPLEKAQRPGGKAARQVTAFREQMAVGDPVLVPAGDDLLLGEVVGPYLHRPRAKLPHLRAVRWRGEVSKAELALPARLQDPRLLFALRGEGDLRGRTG